MTRQPHPTLLSVVLERMRRRNQGLPVDDELTAHPMPAPATSEPPPPPRQDRPEDHEP